MPFPPHEGGGNMDTRHLIAGTKLYLPVHLPGGKFSFGDPHAAQGDGEVCVAAIECGMKASLRFGLVKGRSTPPWFVTPPGSLTPRSDVAGYYGTTGIAPDLMEGARMAVRQMIELLGHEHGLDPRMAYMLCSLAGDLKIYEIVDMGMWNVGMMHAAGRLHLMFLDLLRRRNPAFLEAAIALHQAGRIPGGCYVLDLDAVRGERARAAHRGRPARASRSSR